MLDLKKALIPKPQQLSVHGKSVKIAAFGAAAPRLEVCGEDVRIQEGAALIRARLCELAATCGEDGAYTIRLFVDAAQEKFKGIDKAEAYWASRARPCAARRMRTNGPSMRSSIT